MARRILLDDERLDGPHGVNRVVGPDRLAIAVSDFDQARAAIEELCLSWGGGAGWVVPAGPAGIDASWLPGLEEGVFDRLVTNGIFHDKSLKVPGTWVLDSPHGDSLLAVLAGQLKPDYRPRILASLPPVDDAWFLSYLGAIGSLQEPAEFHIRQAGLVDDFHLGMLLDVDRDVVAEPGADHLSEVLQKHGALTPAQLTCTELGVVSGRRPGDFSHSPTFSNRHWARMSVGPNIVVVYEPGSFEDLCLLWNLRAAHGIRPGLPLAAPKSHAVSAISTWSRVGPHHRQVVQLRGVVSRPWALVSCSVSTAELEDIAAQAKISKWEVHDFRDLIDGGDRPGRSSASIATFADGIARVPQVSEKDQAVLSSIPPNAFRFNVRTRLQPQGWHLPESRAFKRFVPTMEGYQRGGQEREGRSAEQMSEIDWPSGWNVLRAVFRDRGYEIRPSRPGRAAVALLDRLDGGRDLFPLVSPIVVEELYRLGQRTGISYFKQKLRAIGRDVRGAPDPSGRLEEIVEGLSRGATEGDQETTTYSRWTSKLKSKAAAEAWLKWAEVNELLVRGTSIRCDRCGARSWRAVGELGPPIACRGCGHEIAHPFRPDALHFEFRAGQLLLDVVELDVLSHALTVRWFSELLGLGWLYGVHPGIEVLEDGRPVGEIDVVLLFSDGTLGIGECKHAAGGLTDAEIERHESLADMIAADWTFYSTLSTAADCAGQWQLLRRELPERFRAVLTGDDLYDPGHLIWAAGADPFAWPTSDVERLERYRKSWTDAMTARAQFPRADLRWRLDRTTLDEP